MMRKYAFAQSIVKSQDFSKEGFEVKEWQVQGLAIFIYCLTCIFWYSEDSGFCMAGDPKDELIYAFSHIILFYLVSFILLPQFLYKGKVGIFLISLFILFILFGAFEEGVTEYILDPTFRGKDAVDMGGIYWFMVENALPFTCFIALKVIWDNFQNQKKLEALYQNSLSNELRFLRSQIHPHLLFNSLNNLYAYTLEKSEDAPLLVLRLSDILRYMLYECNQTFVPLEKELDYLAKYIELQAIQMEERGEVNFNVENQDENLSIAPFILISFIENCFKHSLETVVKDIEIQIDISIENEILHMYTKNPHRARTQIKEDQNLVYQTQGIGLENAKKRLQLLYPDKHRLDIEDDGNNYQVSLQIQLANHGKL